MTRILITGINSFVGTNFVKYSKYKNVDEISLYKRNPGEIDFGKYEVVIHLVAIVHQKKAIPEEEYFKINRDLCLEVARNAKKAGVRQFIFLSTVKVYGKFKPGSAHWDEKSDCFPDDSYGKSKYAAELALKKMGDQDFIVSIVRTPLVYGEGVRANMLSVLKLVYYSRVLPFKNVRNRRSFTSAENLVAFIDRIIEKKASGVFIAMDKEAISTTDLIKIISGSMGKRVLLFKVPDFIINNGIRFFPRVFERLYGSYEMQNTQTLKILDFEPPCKTDDSIKKMVLAFKRFRKY
jgi:nucleoside-diphosphate-sugar epimerase